MTISTYIAWWLIPLLITIGGIAWAFWITRDDHSIFGGLATILALVPVLFFSALAWAIAGALK